MTKILKVTSCGPVQQVASQKAEGGFIRKRALTLQEIGGKYENQYMATQLGDQTDVALKPGDLVVAQLRFYVSEFNGQFYQDVVLTYVRPL